MHEFLLSNRCLSHIAIINGHWIHLTLSHKWKNFFKWHCKAERWQGGSLKQDWGNSSKECFIFKILKNPNLNRKGADQLTHNSEKKMVEWILMNTKCMLSLSINVNTKLVLYHASVFCAANWSLLIPLNCMFYLHTMRKDTTRIPHSFIHYFFKDSSHMILSGFRASGKKCTGQTIA